MPSPVETLHSMKEGNVFKDFIDYIRFPRFRNLERGSRIDFTFPVTAFVGQNGCSKSSALQALFGCPKGKSVATFWFNTSIDPISDLSAEDRHCLIYSYGGGGQDAEVLKTRINKVNQPDLWDTSEPIAAYAMKMGKRTPPVDKNVIYINFRTVQNAFERAFHRQRPPEAGVQDWIRYRAQYLKRALEGVKWLPRFKSETHKAPVPLSSPEVQAIGKILGRDYVSASLIRHRIFGAWSYSVILKTHHAAYSEAFAGSGESAVVLLVHEIMQAPENSLLLLDEPETSLHPSAQRRVMDFLLSECIRRKHQAVVCTHAPALIETLPEAAVKVFAPVGEGAFRVYQNVLPQEAFYFLGQPLANRTIVRVEDRLAKAIVEGVLGVLGDATLSLFDVRFYPGGHGAMKQDAAIYAREKSSTVLLMDGDQKPQNDIFDPAQMTLGVDSNPTSAVSFLDEKIQAAVGAKIQFASDGGAGGSNKEQQRDARKEYLRYLRRNAQYFPVAAPEEMIWHAEVADNLLTTFVPNRAADIKVQLHQEPNCKKKFATLSDVISAGNTGADIDVVHRMFLKRWLADMPQSFGDMRTLIEQIRQSVSTIS